MASIPMLAPDGTSGQIPQGQMQAAINAGFKIAVPMIAPDGTAGFIPADKQQDAMKAGFKIPGSGTLSPATTEQRFNMTYPVGANGETLGQDAYNVAQNVGVEAYQAINAVAHPLDTAKALLDSLNPRSSAPNPIQAAYHGLQTDPGTVIPQMAGQALAMTGAGMALGAAGDAVPAAATSIREAALGDPNAAALRGLRVPASSPKAIQTLNAVEGARPFLQGAGSLEDLQNRVPVAKQEIWQPYQDALAKVGNKQVKGPDGNMVTVQDLENRRLELSAQLRTLRNGGPEAMALAQQKGLTQANLLREQSAVQMALDPQLRSAGIDPVAIRKAFGQVSQVGSKVAGKSTVAEASQPSGLGRLLNLQIDSPRTWIGEPAQGVRDIAAGRPLWSANPTDLNIREAFRMGGKKPNFTVPVQPHPNVAGFLQRPAIEMPAPESTTPLSQPPPVAATTRAQRLGLLLPAQTGGPIELPYVPEMSGGEQLAALMHYLRTHPQKALPAKASAIPLGSGQ